MRRRGRPRIDADDRPIAAARTHMSGRPSRGRAVGWSVHISRRPSERECGRFANPRIGVATGPQHGVACRILTHDRTQYSDGACANHPEGIGAGRMCDRVSRSRFVRHPRSQGVNGFDAARDVGIVRELPREHGRRAREVGEIEQPVSRVPSNRPWRRRNRNDDRRRLAAHSRDLPHTPPSVSDIHVDIGWKAVRGSPGCTHASRDFASRTVDATSAERRNSSPVDPFAKTVRDEPRDDSQRESQSRWSRSDKVRADTMEAARNVESRAARGALGRTDAREARWNAEKTPRRIMTHAVHERRRFDDGGGRCFVRSPFQRRRRTVRSLRNRASTYRQSFRSQGRPSASSRIAEHMCAIVALQPVGIGPRLSPSGCKIDHRHRDGVVLHAAETNQARPMVYLDQDSARRSNAKNSSARGVRGSRATSLDESILFQ